MNDWLAVIEEDYDVDILFACEAGSRAWGLENDDSDFDIRFIYRYRSLKKYLSLNQAPMVLDFHSPYDAIGFDIFKAMDLISKSNPGIYEWTYSPLIYQANHSFLHHLKKIVETSYSPFSLYKHYGSLRSRNIKEAANGEFTLKKQKQLLQAIRAELIRSGISQTKSVCSPFEVISNGNLVHASLFSAYCTIAEAKKNHTLIKIKDVNKIISLLESVNEFDAESSLPKNQPSIHELDKWIWTILEL